MVDHWNDSTVRKARVVGHGREGLLTADQARAKLKQYGWTCRRNEWSWVVRDERGTVIGRGSRPELAVIAALRTDGLGRKMG